MAVFMSYCLYFGFLGRFSWPTRPDTCLRDMTKNSSFTRFMVVSWAIAHSFCVILGWFICLRGIPKSHWFFVLWALSWAIAHSFGGSRAIYMFQSYGQKLFFLHFMPFSWVIAHSFGVQWWFRTTFRPDRCLRAWPRTRPFRVLWPFSWANAHSFGFLGGFAWPARPDTCLRGMTKNSSFSRFMAISWAISHILGVLGQFIC